VSIQPDDADSIRSSPVHGPVVTSARVTGAPSPAIGGLQESAFEPGRFIEMLPAIAWRAAPDGTRDFHTRAWHNYTGLSADQANGWGWKAAVHPDDIEGLLSQWEAIRSSGKAGATETRLRRFDGQYHWFATRCVPFHDEKGAVVSWYGCSVDVEDHKRAQSRLHSEQDELLGFMDTVPEIFAIMSPEDNLVFVNKGFTQFTGLGMSELVAGTLRQLIFHPVEIEAMEQNRRAGIDAGVPFTLDQRMRYRDGHYRLQRIRYSPLRDNQGRITRWYITGHDVHEQHVASTRLQNENLALREEITRSSMFEEIVGSSEPLRRVLADVARVAASDSTVLILGDTGTGKELIARAVHAHSPRASKAFIRVNCAVIPQSLVASELFGHEKGAFTGALQRRLGRFEAADGGTLFLDEIGELPAETQVALLRVLQEREIERVGSNRPIAVDVRIVAATNRDLNASVRAGSFRRDLFYRLNVFPLKLPSLQERVSDIPLLLEYFIERYARKVGKKITHVSDATLALFKSYSWPGNVRELQNVIERGVILSDGDTFSIDENWLVSTEEAHVPSGEALAAVLASRETELIRSALAASGGRISAAAAKLKLPRQTLASKMKILGIQKK
jgi:formate hydrogenlyase transcriptional activator